MADGKERVAESPYAVKVLPVQPVPRKCTVIGPGRTHSMTGELAEFFIEGRDQFGNRCCLCLHTMLLRITCLVLRGDSNATQNLLSVKHSQAKQAATDATYAFPLEKAIVTMASIPC